METPDEERARVTALVEAKFPTALTPNEFANAVLDIVRGGYEFWDETHDDRLEAIDALAWKHLSLTGSRTWGKPGV